MLIDPDFLDHWRTRALVDLLGGDELAPLYLIRLWSHCQTRKSDTFEIPPAGLKALCRFPGRATDLEEALIQTGWVERDGPNLRACKWLEKNRGLCTAWENGQRGGRPPKPDRNPRVTGSKPTANRNGTGSKPIGLDKTGEDRKESAAQTTPSADADGSGSFDAWWVMYPVRGEGIPRGNKRKAWAEWVKLGDDARADVVEATQRLIRSGTYPKDAERFLKGSKGADPPYRAYLDDSPAPVVIGGSKPTAAQVKESRNHEYDASWLDEYERKGAK